jgi:DNA-binding XRE family transcriptional regulator
MKRGIYMKKTITISSTKELNDALDEMKKEIFFDKSTSEMIRTLLFIGIKSFQTERKNKKKDSTIKSNIKKDIDFKNLREKLGISTDTIAVFSGISEEEYISIENGSLVPTEEIFNSIKDVFTTFLDR